MKSLAWGLGLLLGCRALQVVLEAQPLAALVAQMFLVEWGVTHLGIGGPDEPKALPGRALARRGLTGFLFGLAAAALVLVTLWSSRSVMFEAVPRVELSLVGLGFVTTALRAWRDEMLIHGVPLLALRSTARSPLEMVFACGLTSAGAALGQSEISPESVVVAAELGLVFGTLWTWEWATLSPPSRLAAPAAHAALFWTLETLFSGGLVHARLAANSWAGGNTGILGGKAAVVALAPLCILAVVRTARTTATDRISPRSS